MEPHYGRPAGVNLPPVSKFRDARELCAYARAYARAYHRKELLHYRSVSLRDVTPVRFWEEYVWCVYVSGFNARVVTQLHPLLLDAYGPLCCGHADGVAWYNVQRVVANRKKFEACCDTRRLLLRESWNEFTEAYCQSPETLQQLPFIGKVTRYHLARNIGLDAVKPDLHLQRLAHYFKYASPQALCEDLAVVLGERIGVIDFILWAYCAAVGTRDLV